MYSNGNTAVLVCSVDLVDSVHEAGISEEKVLLNCEVPVSLDSAAHVFFEAGVYNIDLLGSLNTSCSAAVTHDLEEVHLRVLVVSLAELAWADVIDVLQPFEVRAGNSTSIHQKIGAHNNSLLGKNFFSSESGWAVGTFNNNLDVD